MNDLSLFDSGTFEMMGRIADALADSALLPEHLRGCKIEGKLELYPRETRVANCMLVVNAARLWGVDPFQLAGCSYIVGGKLDFDGKFYAALANQHGGLVEKLRPEYYGEGDDRHIVITGRLEGEDESRSIMLHLTEARTKDKNGKTNFQWTGDVDQMLNYAGSRKWVRRHCPQVLLGMVDMSDEPKGQAPETIDVTMNPTQQRLTEQVPTKDFSVAMAELEVAKHQGEISKVITYTKINQRMRRHERDQVLAKGRELWKTLPKSPNDEPEDEPEPDVAGIVDDYDRALRSAPSRDDLMSILDDIESDERLTIDERKKLGQVGNEVSKTHAQPA